LLGVAQRRRNRSGFGVVAGIATQPKQPSKVFLIFFIRHEGTKIAKENTKLCAFVVNQSVNPDSGAA